MRRINDNFIVNRGLGGALATFILSGAVLLSTAVSAASAADKKVEKEDSLSIPVYFITDRNVVQKKSGAIEFGGERQYRGICKHDPHFGVVRWVVDNNKHKSISAHEADLGWGPASTGTNSQEKLDLIKGNNFAEKEELFYSKLNKEAGNSPDNEIFVFVPGYSSTLESGLHSAARFAYYAERPVLLYSWPSDGKLRAYASDESSIEWSQDHFDRVIQHLSELPALKGQKLKVRLFAHSMGSRLVLRAVPKLRENSTFTEVSLVCPDIDDGLFQHYVSKYMQGAKGSATVRLYLSHKDKMLSISKKIHGGYSRLGQTSLSDLQGHVSGDPVKDDVVEVTRDLRDHAGRFQTVDISNLDRGALGHRIPVALVCSLSQTGRPSASFKLVTSKAMLKRAEEASGGQRADESASDAILKSNYLWAERLVAPKHKILAAIKEKAPTMNLMKGKDWTIE